MFLTSTNLTLMSKSTDKIEKAQQLLYIWISHFDKRSLESIKQNCDYLNNIYRLQLSNPIWGIFWPLVFNGVIDHVGNGYYTLSSSIVLDYSTHSYYINASPEKQNSEKVSVGIELAGSVVDTFYKIMRPSPLAILKTYPNIKDVVDNFPKTLQDESKLKYKNPITRRGLAELEQNGLTRYFSLPESLYIRELPSRSINPEAYAIAYCLSRVVNGENNGVYDQHSKILKMPNFAMPFMLYRALLLECMAFKKLPRQIEYNYVFENISVDIIKQLNRILCNSIGYE